MPLLILLVGTIWDVLIRANPRWRFGVLEWLIATLPPSLRAVLESPSVALLLTGLTGIVFLGRRQQHIG